MFHISQLDLLPHLPPASQDSAFSEAFHEAGWANSTQRPQKLVKACGLRMDQQDLRWITHLWCYIWLYNYSNIHWKTWYIYITLYNYIYNSIYIYITIYIYDVDISMNNVFHIHSWMIIMCQYPWMGPEQLCDYIM